MKKRIISLALSAVTAISAVSAMSANALYYWGSVDEAALEETFKDCVKLEGHTWISYYDAEYMFLDTEAKNVTSYYEIYRDKDSIFLTVDEDTEITEITEKIKAVDSSLYIYVYPSTNQENKQLLSVNGETISFETVKKIHEIVGENATQFNYNYNQYRYQNVIGSYITGYPLNILSYNDENKSTVELTEEKLCKYVESHNKDLDLVKYYAGENDIYGNTLDRDMLYVVPKKELTAMEHFELAKNIYEATGYKPLVYGLENATPALVSSTLDLTDYLNGDANCDNIQSMADAAAIFQAIGNPDKYALSDLGEFNADYACDGLTADDAIAIQKKIAGIE